MDDDWQRIHVLSCGHSSGQNSRPNGEEWIGILVFQVAGSGEPRRRKLQAPDAYLGSEALLARAVLVSSSAASGHRLCMLQLGGFRAFGSAGMVLHIICKQIAYVVQGS